MKIITIITALSLTLVLGLNGCKKREVYEENTRLQSPAHLENENNPSPNRITQATATLSPTEGNQVSGSVSFTQMDNGVQVVADIQNLTPGEHGFHIHEKGDCSAHDASSAGGHFNPTDKKHGSPDDPEHHVGDLGNVVADSRGHARLNRVFSFLTLNGVDSIAGKSIIVHADRDDFVSQPSGNSGARQACGVIQAEE
ncbi:MAG: superoxide dismutase family protein [Verrucomicrobiae bacterium]|nr:superoxide dismutase family protein [Verrucomicrobiae bacterium]